MKAAAAILVCFVPCLLASLGAADDVLIEAESMYNHIAVTGSGTERCLTFGPKRDRRQTCMDIQAPDTPLLEYPSMLFGGFALRPETSNVLLIGLGGGYAVGVLQRHLPGVAVDVVEIDPVVADLSKKYFGFRETPRTRVFVEDGRMYLKKHKDAYDQIWLDAFSSDYIPPHLTTREFLELARSRLKDGGVVAQNVHNTNQLYPAHLKTFSSVFRTVEVLEGSRSGNSVILASDLDGTRVSELEERVRRDPKTIGPVDLSSEIGKRIDVRGSDGVVLTDDYCPANILYNREL